MTFKDSPQSLGWKLSKKDREEDRIAAVSPGLSAYGDRWHIKRNKPCHRRCWKKKTQNTRETALCNLCVHVQSQAELDAVRALHRGTTVISQTLAPALFTANSEEQDWRGAVSHGASRTGSASAKTKPGEGELTSLEPAKPSLKKRSTQTKTKGLP